MGNAVMADSRLDRVTAMSVAVLAVWGSSNAGAQPSIPIDKASILSEITEQRASLTAIEATIEIEALGPAASFNDRVVKSLSWHPRGTLSHARIWQAGQGDLPEPNLVRLEASVAGEFLQYIVSRNAAVIQDLEHEEAQRGPIAGGSELLWCMRFLPATDGSWQQGDLESLLRSPLTTVRPATENLDGHPCVVLDRRAPGGHHVESIWLDPSVGWLPRLQQSYDRDGGVGLERRVRQFALVDGRHLPSEWTVTANGSGEPVPGRIVRKATLQTQGGERWGPLVGTAPHADIASVSELLAPGTRVVDMRLEVEYVVGATCPSEGRSAGTELAGFEGGATTSPTAVLDPPAGAGESHDTFSRLAAWWPIGGLLALVAIGAWTLHVLLGRMALARR